LTKDKSQFVVSDKFRGTFSSELSKWIFIPEDKRDSDFRGVWYLQCERQGAEACSFFFALSHHTSNFIARVLRNIVIQTRDWWIVILQRNIIFRSKYF
jgi:hypothetical protein